VAVKYLPTAEYLKYREELGLIFAVMGTVGPRLRKDRELAVAARASHQRDSGKDGIGEESSPDGASSEA
jgi:hypothetical protein